MLLHLLLSLVMQVKICPIMLAIFTFFQGSSIYSETAAANYGDSKIFDNALPKIPLKRLGTVEEVSMIMLYPKYH